MKRALLFLLLATVSGPLLFLSCKKEPACAGCDEQNKPPTAVAGPDKVISLPIDNVLLDGSGSTDPDNNIKSYLWSKIAGPLTASIVLANASKTEVHRLVAGVYQFELAVTDAGGLTAKDTVRVTVNPLPACNNGNRPLINAQLIPLGTLSVARFAFAVASAGDKILFAGGLSSAGNSSRVDIYDITNQTWTTAELSLARYEISAVANANTIVFGGGEISDGTFPVRNVDIYDASRGSWVAASLSAPGTGMATAAVGSKVLFAGGSDGFSRIPGIPSNKTVDIYDVSTGNWTTALLSEAKEGGHVAVTANNSVYIAGGSGAFGSGSGSLAKIDIYDNAAASWSTSLLLQGKAGHAGIALGNKIYWAGGQTSDQSAYTPTCTVEIRDALTGSSTFQSLSGPTQGSRAFVKDNKILFFNVYDNAGKFDIYDVASNSWSIGVLPFVIQGASIVSVNNVVYIAEAPENGANANRVWKLEF